jgi:hypothetical protein
MLHARRVFPTAGAIFWCAGWMVYLEYALFGELDGNVREDFLGGEREGCVYCRVSRERVADFHCAFTPKAQKARFGWGTLRTERKSLGCATRPSNPATE